MITELDIHLPLARALREDARRKAAAQKLQISPHRIKGMRLVKEKAADRFSELFAEQFIISFMNITHPALDGIRVQRVKKTPLIPRIDRGGTGKFHIIEKLKI
jgi:hypothetical protein